MITNEWDRIRTRTRTRTRQKIHAYYCECVGSHIKKKFLLLKELKFSFYFSLGLKLQLLLDQAVGPYQCKETLQGGSGRIYVLLLFPAVSVPVLLVALKE